MVRRSPVQKLWRAVGLGRDPFADAALLDQRGAVPAAEVEEELLRVRRVGRVAVHALARGERALDDGLLHEGVDVALIDADVAVGRVAGGDLAVGDAVIRQWRVADVDGEVLPLGPAAVLVAQDRDGEGAAGVPAGERMPFADGEGGPAAAGPELAAPAAGHVHEHAVEFFRQVEIQRRDTGRNGHADVVGINVGKRLHAGGASAAADQEQQGCEQGGNPSIHGRPSSA